MCLLPQIKFTGVTASGTDAATAFLVMGAHFVPQIPLKCEESAVPLVLVRVTGYCGGVGGAVETRGPTAVFHLAFNRTVLYSDTILKL